MLDNLCERIPLACGVVVCPTSAFPADLGSTMSCSFTITDKLSFDEGLLRYFCLFPSVRALVWTAQNSFV